MRDWIGSILLGLIIIIILIGTLDSFTKSVPRELDGVTLYDVEGNHYKLEWKSGHGHTWYFKYPVTQIHDGDTTIVWKYYNNDVLEDLK